jgi:hypothetical protein
MAEPNQTDERWRELAELLGLPEGAAPAREQAPAPVPPSPPVKVDRPAAPAPREVEVERPSLRAPEEPRFEPRAEEEPPGWESEFDGGDDDTTLDESLLRDEPVSEEEGVDVGSEEPAEPAEPGAPVSEEDKPRRGRRRRRRGRRGGRDGDERPPQAGEPRPERAPQVGEPRRDERGPRRQPDPGQRDRGGRGERRRDEEPRRGGPPPRQERREPAPVDDEVDTPPRVAPALDAADDTDFSNWDVPSWQDLIASLYRPDR